MHWQEACVKSKVNAARRTTSDGLIVERHRDGSAYTTTREGHPRFASPDECEGFMDWEPV